MGPLPWDEGRNCHLFVAIDPFCKWVETHAVPLLHSWRAIELLYDNLYTQWGKPYYVWTDNGVEFVGNFGQLCKELSIVHHHTTVGNTKANGQVEWRIRTLKDCMQCGLMKEPAPLWMNHLASALLLLHMTVNQKMGTILFLLAIGCQPLLTSMAMPELPLLPNQLTLDEEKTYLV